MTLCRILLLVILTTALPAAAMAQKKTEKAILAGGCFWCVESDMDELQGVLTTTSGYTGGTIENPTYENYHDTGPEIEPHIEAVEIVFDPAVVTYARLLDYYFHHIDALDGGGQFCDRGAAYRPVIFTLSGEQREAAKKASEKASAELKKPVAVEIADATAFWPAEEYHRDYYQKNPARYKFYRWNCGRDQRVKELWGTPED